MKNYVISLKTETERRKHIEQEFGKQDISFEFFDAITPPQNQQISHNLSIQIADLNLTQGEISCLLSHISLWKKAIDDDLDYIVIYEDDIHLGENAQQFLNQSNWIPETSEIIKLEAFNTSIFVGKSDQIQLDDDRELYILKTKHVGAAAYILSQHAAKVLFSDVQQNPFLKPLDHILFEEYVSNSRLNVLQVLPALCIQDDRKHVLDKKLHSALEVERRQRFKTQTKQKGLTEKIKKELFRVLIQLLKIKNNFLYNKKRVEFR